MQNRSWIWISSPLVVLFTLGFLLSVMEEKGELPTFLSDTPISHALRVFSGFITDQKILLRGEQKPKNKIIIVGVDNPSIERFGRWPWHRDLYKDVIQKLVSFGPKKIGMDVLWLENEDRIPQGLKKALDEKKLGVLHSQFDSDLILAQTIQENASHLILGFATDRTCFPSIAEGNCPSRGLSHKSVLAISKFGIRSVNAPSLDLQKSRLPVSASLFLNYPELQASVEHAGLFDIEQDPDGVTRNVFLVKFANGIAIPSFALETARLALNEEIAIDIGPANQISEIRLSKSNRKIPVSPQGKMEISFLGKSTVFPRISVSDFMDDSPRVKVSINHDTGLPFSCSSCRDEFIQSNGKNELVTTIEKAELFKDAIVLFGVTTPFIDIKPIPLDPGAPGVITLATIIDNLMSGDVLLPRSSGAGFFSCLLILTLGALLFGFTIEAVSATPAFLICLGTMSAFIFTDLWFFSKNQNWATGLIHMEYGLISIFTLINKYAIEEKRRKFLRDAFSRYVSPQVVETIIRDPKQLVLGGVKKDLSVLFCDIRGFMPLCETLGPQKLQAFLKDYHNIIAPLVIEKGTLDKYIGDSVMAFWGAPLELKNHAESACVAAVQIVRSLHTQRDYFQKTYGVSVAVGIGINSGQVTVGNMGSERVFSYTAVGDDVNLASRVERLTRQYRVNIAMTHQTLKAVAEAGGKIPPHRVIDRVRVVGSKTAIDVVQLLENELPEQTLRLYEEGRNEYAFKRWESAMEKFREANDLVRAAWNMDDGPSQVMLERCELLKMVPLPADWDGSWEMTSK